MTQRLDTCGGRRRQQGLFRAHVLNEEIIEGAEKLREVIARLLVPVHGGYVCQLVGQIAQLHVVVDQLSYAAVREPCPDKRKEQAFRRDGLVENLVAQVVHEPGDLVIRPPPFAERSADRSSSGMHLAEQNGVLVGERMLADPVLVRRRVLVELRGWGRGLPFRVQRGHHSPIVARENPPN